MGNHTRVYMPVPLVTVNLKYKKKTIRNNLLMSGSRGGGGGDRESGSP